MKQQLDQVNRRMRFVARPSPDWAGVSGLALLVSALALGCAAGPGTGGDGDEDTGGIGDGDGDGDGDGPAIGDPTGTLGDQASLADVRKTCDTSAAGPPVLRRLTQGEVEVTFRDIFGLEGWGGVKLSPDASSEIGFTNDAAVLVVGGTTVKEMLKTAEEVAALVASDLSAVLPCAATSADRACAQEFVTKYGLRMFRRPVTEAESARYLDLQESIAGRSNYATGIRWMLTAMLESPFAFYRSEVGTEGAGGRSLDNFEMATELSYMLVGSTPDQTLLDKARAGTLVDPAVRASEATRLLTEHPRKYAATQIFFNEWLKYGRVKGQSRDKDPNFAGAISESMVTETEQFLETLVFVDKGGVDDLMKADFTTLNGELSAFYGYGAVTGVEFQRAVRPPEHGKGILAQGSLLASTSHQAASSPTLRGLLMTERFLCMEAPAVPAIVPTIESTNEGQTANTTREKYELNHASGPACGTCHANFEPFGYTFEGFDEMGRMRTMEGEFPVDTAVSNAPLPDGSFGGVFADLNEVADMVDTSTDIQNCVSGLLASYMFSGAGGTACLQEDARAKVATGEMSIYDFLIALTAAPHFSERK